MKITKGRQLPLEYFQILYVYITCINLLEAQVRNCICPMIAHPDGFGHLSVWACGTVGI